MEEGVTGRTEGSGALGERLAAARLAAGLSLEDIALATRIPKRHLATIEADRTDDLPAIPYTLGFVRSFARQVGIDPEAAATEFRARLNAAPSMRYIAPEPYEPADPARVPPRWLALVALGVAILIGIVYAVWRSGESDDARLAATTSDAPPAAVTPATTTNATPLATTPAPAPTGLVSLTATAPVWVSIYEKNGPKLFEREMSAGQTFEVPAAAIDPRLRTSRPHMLTIKVGDTTVPPVGEPERLLVDQSLKASALLGRPATDTPTTNAPQPIAPLVPPPANGTSPGA